VAPDSVSGPSHEARLAPEIVSLFHRLNNQLGVILANSELLESKLTDDAQRVRAAQVVTGALEAIGTVQHLKRAVGLSPADTPKSGN
jgi:hypothetical protein